MECSSLQEGAMRPKNLTLTARQVHRCAASILQDHLKLPDHGPKCRAGPLLTLLFYAAARITSLSDACRCLRDAPSDEAARLALIATFPTSPSCSVGSTPPWPATCPGPCAAGRSAWPPTW